MKYLKKFNESKKDNKPNIKKMEIDGYLVMFGKDSVSNDYLTLEMTSPEDYWFHAKGVLEVMW
jgi:predicted ribosome quality control (RQC) complex YloA/Tae2 family protein